MRKAILSCLILLLLTLSVSGSCKEQGISLPHGWKTPDGPESKKEWRNEGLNKFLWFKSDFNGDGIDDQANILVNEDTRKMGVFAFLSQKDGTYKTFMLQVEDVGLLKETGIALVTAGKYQTLYGDSTLGCLEGKPCDIVLPSNSIELFTVVLPEKGFKFDYRTSKYFYWDNATNEFRSVWMYE
jgi:hypothetical protein